MQNEEELKNNTLSGLLWSSIERFSLQGAQFVLSIFIARMVVPSDYGLIAMLGIFLAIAQAFIDSGFSNALIQKKDRNQTDYSTVFYFNIVVSVVIYALIYILAPWIARFYHEPQLTEITRALGIIVIISSFSVVQRARLTVALDFKTQAKSSLIAVSLSGICGIVLAYRGYGVWALAVQALVNGLVNTSLLWLFSGWTPSRVFSYHSFKTLFSFGSKLLLTAVLHTLYTNLYTIVIGKKFSSQDLGYYNRAYTFAFFPANSMTEIIYRVLYPVQCACQNEDARLKQIFNLNLGLSAYVIFPVMLLLCVGAHPVIHLFLGEKWLSASDILSILCLAYLWRPIISINETILTVKGRSDLFLKLELICKLIGISVLALSIPLGIRAMCIGLLIFNIINMGVDIYFSKKVIKTGYREQLKILFPILSASVLSAVCMVIAMYPFTSVFLKVFVGGAAGVLAYILFSVLFRLNEFYVVKSIVKKYIHV